MDETLEQKREKLRAMLKADPELARAFKSTLEDMMKPENIEAMANTITRTIQGIQKVAEEVRKGENYMETITIAGKTCIKRGRSLKTIQKQYRWLKENQPEYAELMDDIKITDGIQQFIINASNRLDTIESKLGFKIPDEEDSQ